ncbi:mitochondrial glyco protein [Naematelia encephala]|uniref:Mitochondrial glyco protein n=1 Tax=Naematelia encephala TaxID=71784 RepID=A0A1Y2BGP8_9TREE|nr:mitochondrial glyco protein [Naematelia encephala]
MSLRIARPLLRSAKNLRLPTVRPRAFVRAPVIAARSFSVSPLRLGSGESDSTLVAALASEQKFEKDAAQAAPQQPEFLSDFIGEGIWSVQDTSGSDDVAITRKFGNETLKLTFQVSDLEDPSLQHPTDEEGVPIDDESNMSSPPFITCSLLITKPATPGAMSIDLEAGEEGFDITNVAIFDRTIAVAEGAEGDWARRSRYMGPQFEHLDETVQEAFREYLSERGVDEALCKYYHPGSLV